MSMIDSNDIKGKASELGFDVVGITTAEPFQKFERMVSDGIRSGRLPDRIMNDDLVIKNHAVVYDPSLIMPNARSIIVLGMRYLLDEPHDQGCPSNPRGRISRMHWRNFFDDLAERRKEMLGYLRSNEIEALEDVGIPKKPAAYRAGVGVYGKNTIIQNEDLGSWVLYTCILTDAELSADIQLEPRCGSCQRCIRLCPTKAISEPYVLDASKCLNYVLASDDPIPMKYRELVGDRINGCDLCQEVCPRNENVMPVRTDLPSRFGHWGKSPKLLDVLNIGPEDFKTHFLKLDWYGPSVRTLKRNAIVAIGNTGDCSTLNTLEAFALGEDEDLAEHARWAMDRIIQRENEGQ